jgi:ERCC4-related helicase
MPQKSGRRVLVSTAVAQEGIDIPACNLVILFEPVANGEQLIQVEGRVRAQGRCITFIHVSGNAS